MPHSANDFAVPSSVTEMAEELFRIVDHAAAHLHSVSDSEALRPRGPGKWSKIEELGHLLDSAINNHSRFIRAQAAETLVFPAYDQEAWVALQDYQASRWDELVELWRTYNRHLAQVIARVPHHKLTNMCHIGADEPVTLGFLIEDYLVHLKHHLRLMKVPE